MCRSKAEGGERCSYHLAQGVQSGLATYASALTGLSPAETRAAQDALQREGAHLPDPAPADVEEFLRTTDWRVRHEPTLSESRRDSILVRLRAAVGRVTPSGAQFHAWRHVVAEAWSRSRRRVAVALLAGSMSVGVGACGPLGAAPSEPPPANGGANSTAPATPGVPSGGDYVVTEPTTYDPAAVDRWGAEAVADAHGEMVGVTREFAFREDTVAPRPYTRADFEPLASRMTPTTAADWNTAIDGALAGDPTDKATVQALVYHGDDLQGMTFRDSGPRMTDRSIGAPTTGVDLTTGSPRLGLSMDTSATLRLQDGSTPISVPITKTTTYWLTPVTDGGGDQDWAIDGFVSEWTAGQPTPDVVR